MSDSIATIVLDGLNIPTQLRKAAKIHPNVTTRAQAKTVPFKALPKESVNEEDNGMELSESIVKRRSKCHKCNVRKPSSIRFSLSKVDGQRKLNVKKTTITSGDSKDDNQDGNKKITNQKNKKRLTKKTKIN